jgi:hypothetical protein
MSRPLGELEVFKPNHLTGEADSMDHATASTTLLASLRAAASFNTGTGFSMRVEKANVNTASICEGPPFV